MSRLGMVIDTVRCVGCQDCVIACKTENGVPEGLNRDWITFTTKGRFPTLTMTIQSERCNHCDDPPCVTCCPTGASHVHPFGRLVLVDKDLCIGCKACVASCPYEARDIHPDGTANKCTLCGDRVRYGRSGQVLGVPPTPRAASSRIGRGRPRQPGDPPMVHNQCGRSRFASVVEKLVASERVLPR